MDTVLFLGFALAYLALLVWGMVLARRYGWWTPANLPLLVLAALVYDNGILALGATIGEGPVLEALNVARYWIHAFVTPVLVAWGLHTLRRAGFSWAQERWYQVVSLAAVAVLVVLEILTEIRGLELEPNEEYGVLSYTSAAPADGPPIMVLVVALVLVIAGALVWWKQKWPWLFLGALAMTIGSAIELPVDSGAVTNAFELALLTSIMATKAHQDRSDSRIPGRRGSGR